MRAPFAAAAFAWAVFAGCTLIESKDGLVGPPATEAGAEGSADAGGSDATTDTMPDLSAPSPEAAADDASPDAPSNEDATSNEDAPSDDGPSNDAASNDAPSDEDAPSIQDAPSTETSVGDSGTPVVLYGGLFNPLGITLFGGDVCWVGGNTPKGLYCGPAAGADAGSIRRIDTTGDMSFLVDAIDLALDGTYLYWSDGAQNQVVRRPLDGGAAAQYFTGPGHVSFIALDGTDVWATDYFASAKPSDGTVIVGPAMGPTSTVIYQFQPGASGVAVQGGTVYWGLARGDALAYGPLAGNTTATLVPVNGAVGGVAVDAQNTVFFLGGQSVYRVRNLSGQAETIYSATAPFGLGDIAVDDSWIYWTEPDLGQIVRLHK
jgi:hypothetical protein